VPTARKLYDAIIENAISLLGIICPILVVVIPLFEVMVFAGVVSPPSIVQYLLCAIFTLAFAATIYMVVVVAAWTLVFISIAKAFKFM
jgi:hypothetical protein